MPPTTTVRVVPYEDHKNLLSIADGLEAVREAYLDWAEYPDHLVTKPRHRLFSPESGVRMDVHFGLSPRARGGVRLNSHQPTSNETAQTYHSEAVTTYVIYSGDKPALKGFILGRVSAANHEGRFSTALETTVGTDVLARPDATDLAIFGSGRQARSHLLTHAEIRNFERVRVYSPTPSHREEFAREMAGKVDATIEAVDSPAVAIGGADVILCATNASAPVFDGDLLEPGQHVTSIVGSDAELMDAGLASERRREIDNTTVARADPFVANSVAQAKQNEQGDIYLPVRDRVLKWTDIIDLHDIISGNHSGRVHDDQITVYKQNAGQGITQIALASQLWDRIEAADEGTTFEVPLV